MARRGVMSEMAMLDTRGLQSLPCANSEFDPAPHGATLARSNRRHARLDPSRKKRLLGGYADHYAEDEGYHVRS